MWVFKKLQSRLESPRALWWAVALGILLTLPALGVGLVMDDFAHRAMLAEDAPEYIARGPLDLYRFFRDSDTWRAAAIESGWLPWYADPEVYAEWWRPVTSLTLYLDHLLWPETPALAHAHSLFWYAVLIALVGLLFRRLVPLPWIAGLATILYAVDDAHGHPVAWLANRNAIIAMAFGVGALLAHVKWRQDGWRPGIVVAPLALLFGLLAGEMALSVTAYLFAYALLIERGTLAQRALTLVPCALVSILWRAAYNALGYGGRGSGLYLDPMQDPVRYLGATAARLPVLLQGQLTPLASDMTAFFSGGAKVGLVLFAAVGTVATGAILWRWLRRDRLAAFFATGMIIGTLPICATFASDRLLFPTGIGAMGLLALFFARHSDAELGSFWTGRWVRVLAVIFFITHVVLAPLMLPVRAYQPKMMAAVYTGAFHSLEQLETSLAGRTLIIVTAPDHFWSGFAIVTREEPRELVPDRVQTLATGFGPFHLTREGPNALRLSAEGGFLASFLDRIFQNPDRPFEPKRTVRMSDLTIEVTRSTADGRPAELLCTFTGSLEDPNRVWARWTADGYRPFALPAVGETVEIEKTEVADLAGFQYELRAGSR